MKWIDIPPVWLLGTLLIVWQVGQRSDLAFSGAVFDLLGGLSVGAGLVLIVLALTEMRKRRTTPVPHKTPNHLVTSGIFRRSRNPIYLGDALILTGLILRWDAPLALPLLPLFVWIIERRFIVAEEKRLRQVFKADFARYCRDTRRWI